MPSSEETDGREKLKVTSAATDTLVQESRGTDPSLVEGRRLAAGLGVPAPALHKGSTVRPPARRCEFVRHFSKLRRVLPLPLAVPVHASSRLAGLDPHGQPLEVARG